MAPYEFCRDVRVQAGRASSERQCLLRKAQGTYKRSQLSDFATQGLKFVQYADGDRVRGLLSVLLAGFADGRQDFLGDPLTERLRGWGVAAKEHLIYRAFAEKK